MPEADRARVRVRAIPWEASMDRGEETRHATTVVGYYAAWEKDGAGRVIVPGALSSREAGATLAEAMAAAQADFESRILSAIEA